MSGVLLGDIVIAPFTNILSEGGRSQEKSLEGEERLDDLHLELK
ncbi:hypothetical protein MY4824_009573 [Beauveria thailandica]